MFRKQIIKLEIINKDHERAVESWKIYTKYLYVHILTYFENLKHLSVVQASNHVYSLMSICYLPSSTFSSSILTYLCINMIYLTDCLCLLDDRLKQLNTFIVRIILMDTDSSLVNNMINIFYLLI